MSVCSSGVSMPISPDPLVAATDLDVDRVTVDHPLDDPDVRRQRSGVVAVAPGARTTRITAAVTARGRADHRDVRDAVPDGEQVVDRLVEVVVDGDVGDPLDVESGARPHLQVAPSVVGRFESSAVPGEVVDLDEESVRGDAEVGVHHRSGCNLHRVLTRERRKPAGTHRPFQA